MSHLAGTVTGEGGETAKSGCAGESGDGETALTEPVSANAEFSSLLHAASVPEVTPERASELNQVMDALLDRPEIPGDYVAVMCALARDRRQGEQMRAFALQHLADRAVRMPGDEGTHVQTRLAAIGFCGTQRVKAAEPYLSSDRSGDISVSLSEMPGGNAMVTVSQRATDIPTGTAAETQVDRNYYIAATMSISPFMAQWQLKTEV